MYLEHLCQSGLYLRDMNMARGMRGLRRTPKVPRLVFPPSRWTMRAGAAAAGAGAGPPAAGGPFVEGGDDVAVTGAAMVKWVKAIKQQCNKSKKEEWER